MVQVVRYTWKEPGPIMPRAWTKAPGPSRKGPGDEAAGPEHGPSASFVDNRLTVEQKPRSTPYRRGTAPAAPWPRSPRSLYPLEMRPHTHRAEPEAEQSTARENSIPRLQFRSGILTSSPQFPALQLRTHPQRCNGDVCCRGRGFVARARPGGLLRGLECGEFIPKPAGLSSSWARVCGPWADFSAWGGHVGCVWHGWRFELCLGECVVRLGMWLSMALWGRCEGFVGIRLSWMMESGLNMCVGSGRRLRQPGWMALRACGAGLQFRVLGRRHAMLTAVMRSRATWVLQNSFLHCEFWVSNSCAECIPYGAGRVGGCDSEASVGRSCCRGSHRRYVRKLRTRNKYVT